MATKKYLDYEGLGDVASHVNTRLKTVTVMPLTAKEGAVRLYVGTSTSEFKKGHAYQWNTSAWVDITDDTPHVTGTGNEIDSLISANRIPDGAYVGITDDYDNAYGSPYKKAYINTGAPAYGDEVLESTNVYDAIEELLRSWKTKSDTERNAFACTGLITLTNSDGDTRVPGLCGSYLLTTQRGIDTGTNYFVRLEIWNNSNTFTAGGQTIFTANLTQLGIFYCDYSVINQPYSTSEVQTGTRWIDGKPIYRKVFPMDISVSNGATANWQTVASVAGMNIEKLINGWGTSPQNGSAIYNDLIQVNGNNLQVWPEGYGIRLDNIIIEYTKTTDA